MVWTAYRLAKRGMAESNGVMPLEFTPHSGRFECFAAGECFPALAADSLHDGDLFFLWQKTEHLLERIDEQTERALEAALDAELPKDIIPLGVEFLHRFGVIPVDTRQKHGIGFPKFEFLLTTQLATLGFLELVDVGENDVVSSGQSMLRRFSMYSR